MPDFDVSVHLTADFTRVHAATGLPLRVLEITGVSGRLPGKAGGSRRVGRDPRRPRHDR